RVFAGERAEGLHATAIAQRIRGGPRRGELRSAEAGVRLLLLAARRRLRGLRCDGRRDGVRARLFGILRALARRESQQDDELLHWQTPGSFATAATADWIIPVDSNAAMHASNTGASQAFSERPSTYSNARRHALKRNAVEWTSASTKDRSSFTVV